MKTTKQKILEFIVSYIQEHSYPPTVREIGEGVGLNSTSSVQEHLVCMRDIGMIETDAESGKSRAIRVPGYKFVKEEADGWIPVDERLPENISTVILQVKEIEKPTFGWYGNMTRWRLKEEDFLNLKDFTVNAWMPLPEPYHSGAERKKTNADRIRSMSDEEMADFLPIVSDFMCKPTDKCMENIFNRGECERTKECALKWLQSEVEE